MIDKSDDLIRLHIFWKRIVMIMKAINAVPLGPGMLQIDMTNEKRI